MSLDKNMDYELVFDKNVNKYLKKLFKKDKIACNMVITCIGEILNNPHSFELLKGGTQKERHGKVNIGLFLK